MTKSENKVLLMKYLGLKRALLLLFMLAFSGAVVAELTELTELAEGELPIPEGWMIIEGDIMVRDTFYDTKSTFITTDFWPNGNVPYVFSSNVTAAQQTGMIAAMAEWEAVANVDFYPRNSETNYIFIEASATTNSSCVGLCGGKQTVKIVSWGSRFIMAHELGHALAFWHEQSKPNRDNFVTINIDCVKTDKRHNFDIHTTAGQYPVSGYDFDSVMHYPDWAFLDTSLPGCSTVTRTITVDPPNESWQNLIGQRDHLSDFDVMTMSFLYPENNWRFVDKSFTGFFSFGTFLYPWKNVTDGYTNVPAGGTLWIQPGVYAEGVKTYDKKVTMEAPLGGVTIQ